MRAAAAALSAAGVLSPEHDATVLVAHAMGATPADVRIARARGDALPAGFDGVALDALVARREAREPLQHIVGRAAFRTIELAVGPGVFVPRPETEVLAGDAIDAAVAVADATGAEARVADLCSGSGAIALAVAAETGARVWAVELSADAFAYLERNRTGLRAADATRVTTVRADARTALDDLDGTLDVVAANPPYIPGDARPTEPEVSDFDPPLALYGLGTDGLEVPRGVIAAAARLLRPGGVFLMEHGAPQGDAVRAAVAASGAFSAIETRRDLAGLDRYVRAVRAD